MPLLDRFYWIHSHSDGTDWNAIEVVVLGDKKDDRTCPYCFPIRNAKGITCHVQYCTNNEKTGKEKELNGCSYRQWKKL